MTVESDFIKSKFEEIFGTYEYYEGENNTTEYDTLWDGFCKGFACREIYPLPQKVNTLENEIDDSLNNKENFQWTVDLEIFSKFWGLYLMGLTIPEYIFDYICENQNKITNLHQLQALQYIIGAPNKQDSIVRQMVLAEVA